MKSLLPTIALVFAICASDPRAYGAEADSDSSKITGSIRSPRGGETVEGQYDFKGRTRGAPEGFVAMVFLDCPQAESFFPYGEPGKSNRSFSCTIHHRPLDMGKWIVHLYVLPEADAEKLAAWHAKAARLVEAGMEKKIEPFDQALMKEAIEVASEGYVVERD